MKCQRELIRKRRRQIEAARRSLLESDTMDEAQRHIGWVALLDQATEARLRARISWILPLLVAVVAVAVVILSEVRIPANFVIEVDASRAEFRLNDDWRLPRPIDASGLVLESMAAIYSLGEVFTDVGNEGNPATRAELRRGMISVQELSIRAGAVVTLASSSSEVIVLAKEGLVSGSVSVQSGSLVVGKGQEWDERQFQFQSSAPPESVHFESLPSSQRPAAIRLLHPQSALEIRVGFESLVLLEEEWDEPGRFRSSVLGGEVRVLQIGSSTTLHEGDFLSLRRIDVHRAEWERQASGTLHLVVEGSAGGLLAGAAGYTKNLLPTALEYLYYASPLWLKALLAFLAVGLTTTLRFVRVAVTGGA